MTQQPTMEQRIAALESQIAELQSERAQMRDLTALRVGQNELRATFQAHQEYVSDRLNDFEGHITTRLDVAEDNNAERFAELQAGQQEHKAAIESLAGEVQGLAAGQQQILTILTGGNPRRND